MTRTEIINSLIKKNNYKSYLEIGVQNGLNFFAVKCENKIGVDPDVNSKASIHLTSDDFFAANLKQFDIIFIDGLHEHPQPYKDISNSLASLKEGGIIIVHDCLPMNENAQIVPRIQKQWTGDVWKSWIQLRFERDDLEMFVVDTDCGCGVIRKGKQKPTNIIACSYSEFEKDKKSLLNLISVEEFVEYYL